MVSQSNNFFPLLQQHVLQARHTYRLTRNLILIQMISHVSNAQIPIIKQGYFHFQNFQCSIDYEQLLPLYISTSKFPLNPTTNIVFNGRHLEEQKLEQAGSLLKLFIHTFSSALGNQSHLKIYENMYSDSIVSAYISESNNNRIKCFKLKCKTVLTQEQLV